MPPTGFAKVISFGGNEDPTIGYNESIFKNPAMMTTDADHQKALDALPIEPTSIEDWARMYQGYLGN